MFSPIESIEPTSKVTPSILYNTFNLSGSREDERTQEQKPEPGTKPGRPQDQPRAPNRKPPTGGPQDRRMWVGPHPRAWSWEAPDELRRELRNRGLVPGFSFPKPVCDPNLVLGNQHRLFFQFSRRPWIGACMAAPLVARASALRLPSQSAWEMRLELAVGQSRCPGIHLVSVRGGPC